MNAADRERGLRYSCAALHIAAMFPGVVVGIALSWPINRVLSTALMLGMAATAHWFVVTGALVWRGLLQPGQWAGYSPLSRILVGTICLLFPGAQVLAPDATLFEHSFWFALPVLGVAVAAEWWARRRCRMEHSRA